MKIIGILICLAIATGLIVSGVGDLKIGFQKGFAKGKIATGIAFGIIVLLVLSSGV